MPNAKQNLYSLSVCILLILFPFAVTAHTATTDSTSNASKDPFGIPEWATPVAPWPVVSERVTESLEKF